MADITFRLAMTSDVAVLVELRLAFLREVANADPNDAALREELTRYFASALLASEFMACVAEADQRIVATSGLVFHHHPPSAKNLEGREAYIMNMYTVPAWRGQGIASKLLRNLIDLARAAGCKRVALHELPGAGQIYQKAGFAPPETEMRLEL
jgi:GNAT superfamily N-acetyltransferase